MEKIKYDSKDMYSSYPQYLYEEAPTLSQVVKDLDWGHNNLIKGGGIRINEIFEFYRGYFHQNGEACFFAIPWGLWKEWQVIKEPYYPIKSGTAIGTGGGTRIIIV